MKIKVVFDSTKSSSILNLLNSCLEHELVLYDFKYSKEKTNGIKLMHKYGASKIPFIVFENNKIENNPIWIGDIDTLPTIEQINNILNGKN